MSSPHPLLYIHLSNLFKNTFQDIFSSLVTQKGQYEHTVPVSPLHGVYCSTESHKMIPLTELSLLVFNLMS